jgi:hypothetical protein
MKKVTKFSFLPVVLSFLIVSCNDLDVPVTTQITPDVYPQDSSQFVASAGVVYAALRGNYAHDFFFAQTLSTDEGIMPARGGNWYDNQGYRVMHYHEWTPDRSWSWGCWDWLSRVISYDNQTMYILRRNIARGEPSKAGDGRVADGTCIGVFLHDGPVRRCTHRYRIRRFRTESANARAEVFTFI